MIYKKGVESEQVIMRSLAEAVCAVFKITNERLVSSCRVRKYGDARKVLTYLASKYIPLRNAGPIETKMNLAAVSYYCSCDHSTVAYMLPASLNLIKYDRLFRNATTIAEAVYRGASVEDFNLELNDYCPKKARNGTYNPVPLKYLSRVNHGISFPRKEQMLRPGELNEIESMVTNGWAMTVITMRTGFTEYFIKYLMKKYGWERPAFAPKKSKERQVYTKEQFRPLNRKIHIHCNPELFIGR